MPALAVYAICLVIYALTCGSALGWLDAPELIAGSSSLGIPHSPGHPLVMMVGKFATLLPFGDIAFRVSLSVAACAAGASTAVFCLVRSLLIRGEPAAASRSITAVAFFSALSVSFSWALWVQGVRVEVYALEAMLVVLALSSAFSFGTHGRVRHLLLFALLASLAAANHPAIAATVVVPALGFIAWRRQLTFRRMTLAAPLVGVGLVSLLYLPVRAVADPLLNWGDPRTFTRFVWTISGRAFHKSAGADHASSFGVDLAQCLVEVASAVSIPIALLALVAIYSSLRSRRQVAATMTLVFIVGLSLIGRAVLGFDPETPDHHAYLIGAIVSVAALAALGIRDVAELIEETSTPTALALPSAAIALCLLAVVQFATNLDRSNLADARASDRVLDTMFTSMPPRALVLSAYFETRFQTYAMAEVFGARPDITILDRSFLTYPGAAEQQTRLHPELAELISAPLRAGTPTPIAKLDKLAEKRPILVELHRNVDPALRQRSAPLGAFALFLSERDLGARDRVEALDVKSTEILARASITDVRFDGERAMLSFIWREYLKLELYCELGRMNAARAAHRRLRSIVPEDRAIAEAAARCGLADGP